MFNQIIKIDNSIINNKKTHILLTFTAPEDPIFKEDTIEYPFIYNVPEEEIKSYIQHFKWQQLIIEDDEYKLVQGPMVIIEDILFLECKEKISLTNTQVLEFFHNMHFNTTHFTDYNQTPYYAYYREVVTDGIVEAIVTDPVFNIFDSDNVKCVTNFCIEIFLGRFGYNKIDREKYNAEKYNAEFPCREEWVNAIGD